MSSEIKKLLFQSILGIIGVVIFIALIAHFFKEPITYISTIFVQKFGVYGVGLGIFVADALPGLIIPDAFLVFAVVGKLADIPVIFWASLGSVLGGIVSYCEGRYFLGNIPFGKRLIEKNEAKMLPFIEKYGIWAVVIAATTPLPYSWTCIIVGSFKMPLDKVILASLFRIPRFAVYYYAIKLGWVETLVML